MITCDPGRLVTFLEGWPATLPIPQVFPATRADDPFRGCWQSHVSVLSQSIEPVLILEDDAVFAPAFTLDVAGDWDLWFFGRHTEAYIARDPRAVAMALGPPSSTSNVCARLRRDLPLNRHFVRPETVGQRA